MASEYQGQARVFADDTELGAGTAALNIQPSSGETTFGGHVIVRGVSGVELLKANQIRFPTGEERDITVLDLNLVGSDDGINSQAVDIIGFGSLPG